MYYLIEHNRNTKTTKLVEYSDFYESQKIGLAKEQQYLRNHRNEMEIVIFEADSIEDLKRTHSRYFVKQKDTTGGALVAVGLVGFALYLLAKKK
jgi:hypothetical protein